jgi:hypothetical protein
MQVMGRHSNLVLADGASGSILAAGHQVALHPISDSIPQGLISTPEAGKPQCRPPCTRPADCRYRHKMGLELAVQLMAEMCAAGRPAPVQPAAGAGGGRLQPAGASPGFSAGSRPAARRVAGHRHPRRAAGDHSLRWDSGRLPTGEDACQLSARHWVWKFTEPAYPSQVRGYVPSCKRTQVRHSHDKLATFVGYGEYSGTPLYVWRRLRSSSGAATQTLGPASPPAACGPSRACRHRWWRICARWRASARLTRRRRCQTASGPRCTPRGSPGWSACSQARRRPAFSTPTSCKF